MEFRINVEFRLTDGSSLNWTGTAFSLMNGIYTVHSEGSQYRVEAKMVESFSLVEGL